ncbi:ABC transporter ATP-binding protein, partial [Acidisphaera rubrifaciens]|uniref:ABC transporter ATP-binding protein n=1 Tax=Acidisphaera rubrifaciens TaxID=50715 RepID=UPI000662B805
ENGAGKSTLVKIIYGVLQADEGTIEWDGTPVHIPEPRAARRLGIGMVFQHFSLFDAMTVLENVALGMDRPGRLPALAERLRAVSAEYGLPLDPTRDVHTLSVGERQRIEIVRCLLQSPRLLVMDEPTSVLTPQEVERLFATLRKLAAGGCSILYISHKLAEIRALCDRATVLRGGRVVGACDPKQETAASMAEMMIGVQVRPAGRVRGGHVGAPRLELNGLNLPAAAAHGTPLRDISLSVRAGEIVGIAGVAGNGQNELLAAISGERISHYDMVMLDGANCGNEGPAARRQRGLCCVPEERNGHAAIPDFSLTDNAVLTAYRRKNLLYAGLIRFAAAAGFTRGIVADYDVRTPGVEARAGSLSGGNLQKFIIGREVLQAPEVLVVSQPTWGVDAGAAAAIHTALIALAAAGAAVLLISQDLDELLALSDRLAVINMGALSPPQPTERVSIAELGLLMGGMHGETPPPAAPAPGPPQETAHAL